MFVYRGLQSVCRQETRDTNTCHEAALAGVWGRCCIWAAKHLHHIMPTSAHQCLLSCCTCRVERHPDSRDRPCDSHQRRGRQSSSRHRYAGDGQALRSRDSLRAAWLLTTGLHSVAQFLASKPWLPLLDACAPCPIPRSGTTPCLSALVGALPE